MLTERAIFFMKNIEVIKGFLKGTNCKTQNLKSVDGKLVNYSTTIALLKCGMVFLNSTKYSQTTSTIQNKIRQEVRTSTYRLQEVEGL